MSSLYYRVTRPIVTLCGSTKFKDEFDLVSQELTMQGFIVLSCGVFSHSDNIELLESEKVTLDRLHLDKIMISDLVYIINKDGYIGVSTKKEIEFALKHGKKIIFRENTTIETKQKQQTNHTFIELVTKIKNNIAEFFTPNKERCRNCGSTRIFQIGKFFDSKFGSIKKCKCQTCGYQENKYLDL